MLMSSSSDEVKALIDQFGGPTFVVDCLPDGRFRMVAVNRMHEKATGRSHADWTGRTFDERLPADVNREISGHFHRCLDTGEPVEFEIALDLPVGATVWRTTVVPIRCPATDQILRLLGTTVDITESRRLAERLSQSEERYRQLVERAPYAIWIVRDGHWIFANPAAAELFAAREPGELVGRETEALVQAEHADTARQAIDATLRDGDRRTVQLVLRRLDGRQPEIEAVLTRAMLDDAPVVQAVARDVTERNRVQRETERLAHHDALTGLANRARLAAELERAQRRCGDGSCSVIVFVIDLDGFKAINDGHGHATGDRLLVAVARRLEQTVRRSDLVARLGGDEFAVVVERVDKEGLGAELAERMLAVLCRPFVIEARTLQIGASIGFTIYPHDDNEPLVLLDHADRALYAAKASGRAAWRAFEGLKGRPAPRGRVLVERSTG